MGAADAVEALVGNPFAVGADALATAVAVVIRRHASMLRDASERGTAAVERVLLATAHAMACTAPRTLPRAFSSDLLPPATWKSLPRKRGDYLAVGAAAGRCLRALGILRGDSDAMVAVRRATWSACFGDSLVHALLLARVIHDHDVLVLGETGTGKESVARAVQEGALGGEDGGRAPSAALNIAAIPETLVAAELFGHQKGAFTGANEARIGLIRSADGGSLFLDEVGDLSMSTQVKLLRVMETNDVTPLGSDRAHHASCRYVAATHRDLDGLVANGQFRRDLHQRLAGNVIRIPALRDRPEDIPAIGEGFMARYISAGTLPVVQRRISRWLTSDEARRHAWPGNVRELENAIRNMLLGLAPGVDVAPAGDGVVATADVLPRAIADGSATLSEAVSWYVQRVVDRSGENLAEAARSLGVDRNTVRRRLRPPRPRARGHVK